MKVRDKCNNKVLKTNIQINLIAKRRRKQPVSAVEENLNVTSPASTSQEGLFGLYIKIFSHLSKLFDESLKNSQLFSAIDVEQAQNVGQPQAEEKAEQAANDQNVAQTSDVTNDVNRAPQPGADQGVQVATSSEPVESRVVVAAGKRNQTSKF